MNSIDNFVIARLAEAGLRPANMADKRTLVRRLYYDLIGLPPRPAQVNAFLSDESHDAYERLVDELLRSPRFGEKWARHWMDLVRYAETLGHEFDYPASPRLSLSRLLDSGLQCGCALRPVRPRAYRGRFAGKPSVASFGGVQRVNHRHGVLVPRGSVPRATDVRQDEADRIDNQIDVFSKAFLGLTVACARCHDHKFDPIPTKDYYALSGYIQSSRRQEAMLDPHDAIRESREMLEQLHGQLRSAWNKALPDLSLTAQRSQTHLLPRWPLRMKTIVR